MESSLFEHLNVLIIADNGDSDADILALKDLLMKNNCHCCEIYKDSPVNHETSDIKKWFSDSFGNKNIHFVISQKCNFFFYSLIAFDLLIPVVTPEWAYQSLNSKRLLKTLNYSPDPCHILKDASIYISRESGFTGAEFRFYNELVYTLGGSCINNISSKTTHVIASNSRDPAVVKVHTSFRKAEIHNSPKIHFIYPTWLIHCFKSLKVACEDQHAIQINESNDRNAEIEYINDNWQQVEDEPFNHTLSILAGHEFIIDINLSLPTRAYNFIVSFIKSMGGRFTPYIETAEIVQNVSIDCFIGHSTRTRDYDISISKGLNMGNLIWLLNMWSFKKFMLPSAKIVWHPFRPKSFKRNELVLAYTNYFGQERAYIQRLTDLLGGISTTSLSKKNTHLISKTPYGKKFVTAKSWKETCKVVNHCWLEKCYQMGEIVDTDLSIYNDFESEKKGIRYYLNQLTVNGNSNVANVEENRLSLENDEESTTEQVKNEIYFSAKTTSTLEGENPAAGKIANSVVPQLKTGKFSDRSTTTSKEDLSGEETDIDYSTAFEENDKMIENNGRGLTEENIDGKQESANKQNSKKVESSRGEDFDDLFGDLSQNERETPLAGSVNMSTPTASRQSSSIQTSNPNSNEKDDVDNILPTKVSEPITPPTDTSLLLNLYSSTRRAARAEAEKRLHSDIESLNEFEKNKKKKRLETLLPDEIKQLKQVKKINEQAKKILLRTKSTDDDPISDEEYLKELKHSYKIRAYITGCHENLTELDLELLRMLGIKIAEDYNAHLNCIIAQKVMRTAKFLNCFSFHPLEYLLLPEFITDILKKIKRDRENPCNSKSSIHTRDYHIPGIDQNIIRKTQLYNKLFERAHISTMNIMGDIPGGFELISSILKNHGIKETNRVGKEFSLISNEHTNKRISLQNGKIIRPPSCVVVATSTSQVKKLKQKWQSTNKDGKGRNNNNNTGLLVVNWDWCVSTIFSIDVDYDERENVMFCSL